MTKVYKIIDKKTGKPIELGYKRKRSWLTFPSEAIKENQHMISNNDDYYVEEYELIPTKKWTLDKKEIKSER